MKNKTEILSAISTIEVNCWDFAHEFDGEKRGYAKCTKSVESDNFNIDVEIEEEVRWSNDGQDFEPVAKTITDLTIIDDNGKQIETTITDRELLDTLGL